MFLDHIKRLGLLDGDETSNILAVFPLDVRRVLIQQVTESLLSSTQHEAKAGKGPRETPRPLPIHAMLHSSAHVQWVMEVVGHGFALPIEDVTIIQDAVSIYTQWLLEPSLRPALINEDATQHFIQVYNLFLFGCCFLKLEH